MNKKDLKLRWTRVSYALCIILQLRRCYGGSYRILLQLSMSQVDWLCCVPIAVAETNLQPTKQSSAHTNHTRG